MFEIIVVYLSISIPVCLRLSVPSVLLRSVSSIAPNGCLGCVAVWRFPRVYLSCLIVCLLYLCQAVSVYLSVRLYPSVGCANVCLYLSRSVRPCLSIRLRLSPRAPYIFRASVNEVNTSPLLQQKPQDADGVPDTWGIRNNTRRGTRSRPVVSTVAPRMVLKPSAFAIWVLSVVGRDVRGKTRKDTQEENGKIIKNNFFIEAVRGSRGGAG